tara:strand:- start:862 stop:1116 length:255 start_codon:yes stop_codon:yes gene_type:complete
MLLSAVFTSLHHDAKHCPSEIARIFQWLYAYATANIGRGMNRALVANLLILRVVNPALISPSKVWQSQCPLFFSFVFSNLLGQR